MFLGTSQNKRIISDTVKHKCNTVYHKGLKGPQGSVKCALQPKFKTRRRKKQNSSEYQCILNTFREARSAKNINDEVYAP